VGAAGARSPMEGKEERKREEKRGGKRGSTMMVAL